MKKVTIAITTLLILGVMALLIIRINSFPLALGRAGFLAGDVDILEHSFDSNNHEFKVLKTSSAENEIVLAIVTRNNWGFWSVTSARKGSADKPGLNTIGWIGNGGFKRYEINGDTAFEQEWHIAYYGNNAAKLIEFLPGQIPENATVNIRQAGKLYWIHIITFAEPEVLNSIDIPALLKKNQCIDAE